MQVLTSGSVPIWKSNFFYKFIKAFQFSASASRPSLACKLIEAFFQTTQQQLNKRNKIFMPEYKITTEENVEIKFEFYLETAPLTSKALIDLLP